MDINFFEDLKPKRLATGLPKDKGEFSVLILKFRPSVSVYSRANPEANPWNQKGWYVKTAYRLREGVFRICFFDAAKIPDGTYWCYLTKEDEWFPMVMSEFSRNIGKIYFIEEDYYCVPDYYIPISSENFICPEDSCYLMDVIHA